MLAVTGRVFESPKCDKMRSAAGLPQTHWGSFSAPPAPLGTIGEGVLLLREREGEGKGYGRGR